MIPTIHFSRCWAIGLWGLLQAEAIAHTWELMTDVWKLDKVEFGQRFAGPMMRHLPCGKR